MVYLDENTRINSDDKQFYIERKTIAKSGANEGKEIWNSDNSFHPNLSSLLETLLKRRLFGTVKKKDYHSLDEFLEALHKEIKKFDKTIRECAIANSKVLPEIQKKATK